MPLLSTAYLPPIQYFTKMLGEEVVFLEQHEHYQKQTYRNRCVVCAASGPTVLTIPVVKLSGEKMPIRDVRIDYAMPWQRNHWKTLVSAYRNSPFFDYYEDDLRPFYEREEPFLFDFNEKLLHLVMGLLGLRIEVEYTTHYQSIAPAMDWRELISPKADYTADKKFKPQSYYQVFSSGKGFAANLSIIDLLCNEGNNSLSVLQSSLEPVR